MLQFNLEPDLDKIENNYMNPIGLQRRYFQSVVNVSKYNFLINIHSFAPQVVCPRKPTAVLIHGTASTCFLAFSKSFLHNLTKHFNVYLLDLPGFGRSTAISTANIEKDENIDIDTLTPIDLLDSTEDIITFFVKYIYTCRQLLWSAEPHPSPEKNKCIFIAHSFGTFLSLHYAKMYQTHVDHLYLVNSIGILNVGGVYGAWWGACFKFCLPNILGRGGSILRFLSMALTTLSGDDKLRYMIDVLSMSGTWGDKVLAKCITLTKTECFWNFPALNTILEINIPICLIQGVEDSISPIEQARKLHKLLGIQLFEILDCAHSPLAQDHLGYSISSFIANNNHQTLCNRFSDIQKSRFVKCVTSKSEYRPSFNITSFGEYNNTFRLQRIYTEFEEIANLIESTTET